MIGNGFMLLIAALYLCAAVGYASDDNWWMALVATCYAVANAGLVGLAVRLKL